MPASGPCDIGVDVLPAIPQDNTDRNRTSPMAFTGNKFEFRMLGSSQSIAGPNIALNTIMAEELEQFADELEGSKDFQADLAALHPPGADGASAHHLQRQRLHRGSWVAEAEKRGLCNFPSTAEALPAYIAQKNVDLFVKHGIYTPDEVQARYEIHAGELLRPSPPSRPRPWRT